MNVTIYGLAQCDTVKRAQAWLVDQGIDADFHDFKKAGVPPDLLEGWLDRLGWEALLNRKGSTWRKLDEPARIAVVDRASARALMLAQPSVIKRPVVAWGPQQTTVGFDAAAWALQRATHR